jgi:hypothetical protein
MCGRTAGTFLLVLTLLLALSVAGCGVGREETVIEESGSGSRMVVISGRVQVKGDLHGSALKLSATPVPGPIGSLEDSLTHLAVKASGRQVSYKFEPLPLEVERKMSRSDHEALRPASKAAVAKAYRIDHYVVRLAAPAGWSVKSDQYEVRADTTTADFVLQKK